MLKLNFSISKCCWLSINWIAFLDSEYNKGQFRLTVRILLPLHHKSRNWQGAEDISDVANLSKIGYFPLVFRNMGEPNQVIIWYIRTRLGHNVYSVMANWSKCIQSVNRFFCQNYGWKLKNHYSFFSDIALFMKSET